MTISYLWYDILLFTVSIYFKYCTYIFHWYWHVFMAIFAVLWLMPSSALSPANNNYHDHKIYCPTAQSGFLITCHMESGYMPFILSHWGLNKMVNIAWPHFQMYILQKKVLYFDSLQFVHKGPIDNMSALVHVMAWCWTPYKPLSEIRADEVCIEWYNIHKSDQSLSCCVVCNNCIQHNMKRID